MNFYSSNEENPIEESISNYQDLFEKYIDKKPTKEEALEQMFISARCSKDKANQLIKTILTDVSYFIDKNERFKKIKDKYKDITKEDSLIICIYTYEFYSPDDIYNTYSILNSNMASNNRKQGIKNVNNIYFYC